MNTLNKTKTSALLWWLTGNPKKVLLSGLLAILFFTAFLPQLTMDPEAESFLPKDSPALIYRQQVEDIFGLNDPMVIAVTNEGKNGIFNPDSIELIHWLTQKVLAMPAVNQERVISLTTEDNISGNAEGLVVEPFVDELPISQQQADGLAQHVFDFPLYVGSIVSKDASTSLIVIELTDDANGPALYESLLALVAEAPIKQNEVLHVAGDGAVSGYLSTYIVTDASRLVPLSVIIITLLCFFAFRTVQGTLLPGIVILAAATSAMGVMSAMGDPIYVITTSMPILLVGIAVADSIHIMSEYYEQRAAQPELSQRLLVIDATQKMWRPIVLTTVTSMIGFFGVYLSSYMPPMQAFGIYSMLGLAIAGIYSLCVVPACLMLMPAGDSSAFKSKNNTIKNDIFSTFMTTIGKLVLARAKTVLTLSLILAGAGIYGAMNLSVNESWVDNFKKTELIYQADVAINATMNGTSNLDIVVSTHEKEGLFKPENLHKIEKLQDFVERFDVVGGSTSIADYIKQMNRSLNENKPSEYRIPNDENLISQYFLLYAASGDPTDFEEEIDYDYQQALVRVQLTNGRLQSFKPVVEALQVYINNEFNDTHIKASLSGRVYVDYEWLTNLVDSHFKGVALALLLVWLVACLAFKSIGTGSLALVPVMLSTLAIYAFMGAAGITLAVGTTMTAAIGLGIGIDFAVHTIERVKVLIKSHTAELHEPDELNKVQIDSILLQLFPSTGRALLFNFFAVFLGFGVLGLSYVPPLAKLGMLIAFAVSISFIVSITVLPALIKIFQPRFLGFQQDKNHIALALNEATIESSHAHQEKA
ncbi:efflux RND transporter permease subunit [Algibacillus agarilyticus]|uniref:efflux RND transporter permease subunit n=1 Tax=Algibacillus agarilyticus TaxID=2234133 RepID=UPI000DD0AF62|nr:MMPL family transporter [Algibacillus agarilyticus]